MQLENMIVTTFIQGFPWIPLRSFQCYVDVLLTVTPTPTCVSPARSPRPPRLPGADVVWGWKTLVAGVVVGSIFHPFSQRIHSMSDAFRVVIWLIV